MSILKNKKSFTLFTFFALLLAIPITIYTVQNQKADIRSRAEEIQPTCRTHNDCPPNWMYCLGGKCYSYSVAGSVGMSCTIDFDCKNALLNCVNGSCQRVVGEPGGCSDSYDCVEQYRGTDQAGRWTCTNGQCIKVASSKQYFDGDKWVDYGTNASCLLNSDCGQGAECVDGYCFWVQNQSPCYSNFQCPELPSDITKKYVCITSGGTVLSDSQNSTTTGSCQVIDACDPRIADKCGPGTHQDVRTIQGTPSIRHCVCIADSGTTWSNGQAPAGWNMTCPEGEELIESCSNTTPNQRVRYCSSGSPDDWKDAVRWNNWRGPNGERCLQQGEVVSDYRHDAYNVEDDDNLGPGGADAFYDLSQCSVLQTRTVRCSTKVEGRLISFCSEDRADPESSSKTVVIDNWVGANGEKCTTSGMTNTGGTSYDYYNNPQGGIKSPGSPYNGPSTTNNTSPSFYNVDQDKPVSTCPYANNATGSATSAAAGGATEPFGSSSTKVYSGNEYFASGYGTGSGTPTDFSFDSAQGSSSSTGFGGLFSGILGNLGSFFQGGENSSSERSNNIIRDFMGSIIDMLTGNYIQDFCIGDLNGDGVVDTEDFKIISDSFDTTNVGADLNGDGVVNILDVEMVTENFGCKTEE